VKFTDKGEVAVEVTPHYMTTTQMTVRFAVHDTGIGIPADHQARLFHSFTQVDASTTRKYGGTGLGLAISKRLTELMGGEIGVESEPGQGSTFWFTVPFALPVLRSHQGKPAENPPALAPLRPPRTEGQAHPHWRILIAEDNIINQKLAMKLLEKLGYHADVAANGREALTALSHIPYDAVLMDCQMPEMDGFTATRRIREREESAFVLGASSSAILPHIPIIAMTANAMTGDRDQCLEAGMDDYVAKPIKPLELRAILERWLDRPARVA
jgi:CheY-like chemotaxis protein